MTIDFDCDSVISFKAVTDGESVTVVHLDIQGLKFTGSAKCLPSDTFDPYTGELLAAYRAAKKWMKSMEKELHEIGGVLE